MGTKCTRLPAVTIFCILLAAAVVRRTQCNDDRGMTLPHLEYTPPVSYLLASGQPWTPGQTTRMTALMAGAPLTILVSLNHEDRMAEPPCVHLLYKCNASSLDGDFRRIRLAGNSSSDSLKPGAAYCGPYRPFVVMPLQDDARAYNLTLTTANRVPFDQALSHSLEFRLHVEFAEGELESRSLFVYNFDALAKIDDVPMNYGGVPYTRYILSNEGLRFMFTLTGTQNQGVEVVRLLNDEFLRVYNTVSSLHIRSTIAVSVMIRGQACTNNLVTGFTDFVISTGDPNPAIASTFTSYSDIVLHLPTGNLYFSRQSVSNLRSTLTAKHATNPLRICIRLSINSPVWDYHLTLTVTEELRGPFAPSDTNPVSPGDACTIAAYGQYGWRILTEGSLDVLLLNPIVCPVAGSGSSSNVYFEERECTNYIQGTAREWQKCNGYSISRTGGAVKIGGPVGQQHAGNYRFYRRGIHFLYLVTVIAFPLFRTSLPHTTFANLDTQVRLNCTAFHDGMSHVMLEPQFRVFERFRRPRWRVLTLDEFALQILQVAPRSIRQVETKTREYNGLLVILPHVNRLWQSWVLTYTCRATLIDEDIRKLGLPGYQADTGTDVVYFGERINSAGAVTTVYASTGLLAAAAAAAAALASVLRVLVL